MSTERLRIVVASWMVRYPLGGNLSWALAYLLGFHRLGHEVWLLERAEGPDDCFDPVRGVMSDDPSAGVRAVDDLLDRYGLGDRWGYLDHAGRAWGLDRQAAEEVANTADVFLDLGAHGSWASESAGAGIRVLVDGEPAFTQARLAHGSHPVTTIDYDAWVTVGANIGGSLSTAPDDGREWLHLFHPVVVDLFDPVTPPPGDGAFTTVMNWRSYPPLIVDGREYGQKDRQFPAFQELPTMVDAPLELALSGPAPRDELHAAGWRIQNGHAATSSFEAFRSYIRGSLGEFAVAKHGFVSTQSGWFSDRSAAYLASGRPVVMEDTGFGSRLPTGEGLFAVGDVEAAADAITEVSRDYAQHSRRAREIAGDILDARVQLPGLLEEIAR